MTHHVCATCGTQFADTPAPPSTCPICLDPRQYVPASGQRWTTLDELRAGSSSRREPQGELLGVGAQERVGIGQRALLVPFGDTNLLWDCVALLDEAGAAEIERRGGLGAIAISHPHYYTTMVEWAHRFDCPVLLHAADAEWIMRPDPSIELWDGERRELGHGLSLHRLGAHFPGMTVAHHAHGTGGAGTLLSGDLPLVVADPGWVTFMWSYPNLVPLPAAEVSRVAARLAELPFETLHDAFWDHEIVDASAAVARSARRYVKAATDVPETHPER